METVISRTASLSLSNYVIHTRGIACQSFAIYCNLLWNFFALLTIVYSPKRIRGVRDIYDLCIYAIYLVSPLWHIVFYTLSFLDCTVKIVKTTRSATIGYIITMCVMFGKIKIVQGDITNLQYSERIKSTRV